MTVTINYDRNNESPPFVLTETQRAQLEAILNAQKNMFDEHHDQMRCVP